MTIVDGEAIIGYYPKRLIPALKLDAQVDLSGDAGWLADKYERILGATLRVVRQLTPEQMEKQVPWRPQSLRELLLHVLSFPELAWTAHQRGSMTPGDMQEGTRRAEALVGAEDIAGYGERVRRGVAGFLRSGNDSQLERVVTAHYGGEVSVIELLHIILRHSTHHLNQAYWFMETGLGVVPIDQATGEDLEGIATPMELI